MSQAQPILAPSSANEAFESILTPAAMEFLGYLHEQFYSKQQELLKARKETQKNLQANPKLSFLKETKHIREGEWQVASTPRDLMDRRVEITGPTDRKMMINALNSGAKVFMADLEDSCSPTWDNVLQGQLNIKKAIRRNIDFRTLDDKEYKLNRKTSTLIIRPRGLHLSEKNCKINGQPASASLFDFGLTFFHNALELIHLGSGPYFYLPKLENHLEARFFNEVFVAAQNYLNIPKGTIRATVLIETITAAFEMEEILYELREHASGLNAGRWDYIFSMVKKFGEHRDFILPDRSDVTMTVPFMRAYCQLIVHTCHKRNAHAMGGMSAFIPSRKDQAVTENALQAVREDKEREAMDGFDGTWVAHPDLVPVAKAVFDLHLKDNLNQKHKALNQFTIGEEELLNPHVDGFKITEAGVRTNISVALQYISAWLKGLGAVAINHMMEDAATAEISRSQLWQWVKHQARLESGASLTINLYQQLLEEEVTKLSHLDEDKLKEAVRLLNLHVLDGTCKEFFTLEAYNLI